MANKPSFLTGGAGAGGHLNMKRGTEDLDFFIGDEALAAANGPGMKVLCSLRGQDTDWDRLWYSLPYSPWTNRELGMAGRYLQKEQARLTEAGSYGKILVKFDIQISTRRA